MPPPAEPPVATARRGPLSVSPPAVPPRAPAPAGPAGRCAAEPHRRPTLPAPGTPRHAAGQGPGGRGVAVLPFCHYSFVKCF